MTLETSKNLGGVGAILIAIGGLGFLGTGYAGLLSLIGLILVLISLKGFADHYSEAGIFNNALFALIMGIIGVMAVAGIALFYLFSEIFTILDVTAGDWTGLSSALQQRIMSGDLDFIWRLLGVIILAWVVLSIFIIISTIFSRKSLSLLSAKTGVSMFGTAGMLMLIGGILFVIFIGALLIWIAWILVAVAFFSIRTQPTQPQPTPTPA